MLGWVNLIVCEQGLETMSVSRKVRGELTFAKALPLMSAAVLITVCSARLLTDRSLATTGARGFRLELVRASKMVSYSSLGFEVGAKYFRIDLGEDLLEEALRIST